MAKHTILTSLQIDRLLLGTRIGGRNRNTASLAAARDYLTGRYRTMALASEIHGATPANTRRVVSQILRLAAEESQLAACVQVGVTLPPEHLDELEEWVDARGGEVLR